MGTRHQMLLETHILGPDTLQYIVRGESCPALHSNHIAHVGVGDATAPLQIIRTHLSGAYLHGTIGGEGRMLLDGRWQTHLPCKTSLAPAHVLHAFQGIPGLRWQYCWVRYTHESPRSTPSTMAPVMADFDARPLWHAIMGLYYEIQRAGDAGSCQLWVDAIERYVERFVAPRQKDKRLLTLWNTVQADLARPWLLEELASLAKISNEHLRRLCQGSLGRSPMQQLTHLRIQHAAHLLATTTSKIDSIAQMVGYTSPFAFSNTFKRMTGFRPSTYRTRQTHGKRPV